MSNLNEVLQYFQNYPGGRLFLVANLLVIVCVIILFMAIFLDFVSYHKQQKVKKRLRSWVETGSMFAYFGVYYLLLKIGVGKVMIQNGIIHAVLIIIGMALVAIGCFVNVKGRLDLKDNWANQVTIYNDHTLIVRGMFRFVRHPLYSSLILMLVGGGFIYMNFIALVSVMFVFIPMMYYRAKQEERLLSAEFVEYIDYQKKVGMFFPKIKFHG